MDAAMLGVATTALTAIGGLCVYVVKWELKRINITASRQTDAEKAARLSAEEYADRLAKANECHAKQLADAQATATRQVAKQTEELLAAHMALTMQTKAMYTETMTMMRADTALVTRAAIALEGVQEALDRALDHVQRHRRGSYAPDT